MCADGTGQIKFGKIKRKKKIERTSQIGCFSCCAIENNKTKKKFTKRMEAFRLCVRAFRQPMGPVRICQVYECVINIGMVRIKYVLIGDGRCDRKAMLNNSWPLPNAQKAAPCEWRLLNKHSVVWIKERIAQVNRISFRRWTGACRTHQTEEVKKNKCI